MVLTAPELEVIEAREKAATKGPWVTIAGHVATEIDTWIASVHRETGDNAEFIANARTDIPRLLEHVKEQAAEIVGLKIRLSMSTVDESRWGHDLMEEQARMHAFVEKTQAEAANLRAAVEYACSVLAHKPFQDSIRAIARGEET